MKQFTISEIPQADELEKVILTAEAVFNGQTSDLQIADYVGFTDRQGRYYRFAGEILGLLKNENNKAYLTELGGELVLLDNNHRLKQIRNIIAENKFFHTVLRFIESHSAGVSRKELLAFLASIVDGAESTIGRRLSTVTGWLIHVELIKIDFRQIEDNDKENVYVLNEDLDSDDDSKGSIYPTDYDNRELDIKETHTQVIGLVRKHKQEKIKVPEFQRNQVWKQQQQSRFIESLILNIPIPPFYVSQDLEGNYIIVDGLQRTGSIIGFLNNEFYLTGLEALPQLNNKYFKELEEDLRTRIEDRDLLLYILKSSVPLPVVFDIFNRINSNGTPLTRQEIRNCIFIGNSTRLLKELSESDTFKEAIDWGIPSKRMKDREAILRYFAFTLFNYDKDYKGDLDDFLGRTMRKINRMSPTQVNELKSKFYRVMSKTFDFFGAANFRLPNENSRGRINIAIMESICFFFDLTSDKYLEEHREQIIQKFTELLKNPEYLESVRYATGSEKHVRARFRRALEILGN